jgi:hypothetical protein
MTGKMSISFLGLREASSMIKDELGKDENENGNGNALRLD